MIRRHHSQVGPAFLTLAFAAGAAVRFGNCALAEESLPAQGQAAAASKNAGGGVEGSPTGYVNVKDFSNRVVDGDWSPAIQAAIDHVSAANGYGNGTTIFFPPGTYRIDQTIRLGKDRAHYGTRLSGYGAVLLGTKTLDTQPVNYEERLKAATERWNTEAEDEITMCSLPGELDLDGKTNVGVPILELWNPADLGPGVEGLYPVEGSSFVIEGLTFDRDGSVFDPKGVGIKIPAETVPKNITFRDVKVNNQNVGVHINHCYQIRFESCLIRGNRIGIWGRNHWNSVSIVNCEIRRQHLHGVVIGPNFRDVGSTSIYIAGSIFEDIKGYGILNAGGNAVTIVGNYFECVGNGIGVLTPYWSTTIEGNAFLGFYGHGWNINKHGGQVVADKAHIVIDAPDVQLRNNKYYNGQGILLFGTSGQSCLDGVPLVAPGANLPDGLKVGDSVGLGAYVYSSLTDEFSYRPFAIVAPPVDEALRARVIAARKALAEAKTADEKVIAQDAIAGIWLERGDFVQTRREYEKAWAYPAADQTNLRAFIQMRIADSYMQEKAYTDAENAYAKALEIGPGGWHKDHCEQNLKKARELAGGKQS